MSNKIILKKTFEAGKVPLPTDLEVGELAINARDGVVFSKDDSGEVFIFGSRTQAIKSIASIAANEGTLNIPGENTSVAMKGGKGVRVIANQNSKEILFNLDNPDAFTLEGKRASAFSLSGHSHDGRYVGLLSSKHQCVGGKWYRLYEGASRCNGRFTICEGQSSQHGYVRFEAGVAYGKSPYINILASNGYNNGNGTIRFIRLVTNKADKTYGPVAIEVFIDADAEVSYYMDSEYSPHNAWNIKSAVEAPAEHTEFDVEVSVDLDLTTGFHSTGAIFENGEHVFSKHNKPSWSDITGIPSTLPPSEHNHDTRYYLKSQVDAKFDAILNGASEELNSFKELADALTDKGEAIAAINAQLATKANKAGDTFTGAMTFQAGISVAGKAKFAIGEGLELLSDDTYFGQHNDARVFRMIDTNGTGGSVDGGILFESYTPTDDVRVELLRIRNGEFKWKGATIWHANNDGAGSGLDADLLDGQQGSFYQNASNLNAGVVNAARLSGHYGISVNSAKNAKMLGSKAPEYFTNATNLLSGIVPAARLSGTYAIAISGNAATASKWAAKRTVSLTGDVTGSVQLDGSGDVSIATTVANDSHTHDGRYYTKSQVPTFDQVGLVSGGGFKATGKTDGGSTTADIDALPANGGVYHKLIQESGSNGSAQCKTGYHYIQQYVYGTTSNATQIAIPYGTSTATGRLAYRTRYSGAWRNWAYVYSTEFKPTAQDVGAVSKSGDTIGGHLAVQISGQKPAHIFEKVNSSGLSVYRFDAANGLSFYHAPDSANGAHVVTISKSGLNVVTGQLKEAGQRVYSPNNKPTAQDVGALSNKGGEVAGDLRVTGTCSIATANPFAFQLGTGAFVGSNHQNRMTFYASTDKEDTKLGWLFRTRAEGVGKADILEINAAGGMDLKLGDLKERGARVYSPNNKPKPADIGALPVAGGTLTGNLKVQRVNPYLWLYDTDTTVGTGPHIKFSTANTQGVELIHKEHDAEVPGGSGYSLRLQRAGDNIQGLGAKLDVQGEIYELDGKRVYSEGHKPTPSEIGVYSKSESDGRFAKKIKFSFSHHYCSVVILLVPCYTSGDPIAHSYVSGEMSFTRDDGTSRNECLSLEVKTGYKGNSASLSRQGIDWNWRIVSVLHGGVKWLALANATNANGASNVQNAHVEFIGRAFVGTVTGYNKADQFKVIPYREDKDGVKTILNAEVNDSLTAFSTSTLRDELGSEFYSPNNKPTLDDLGLPLYTIETNLTVGTEWLDTGINLADLPSGSYLVQISGMASSATSLYGEIFTGVMSWFSEETNSLDVDEILLHKAGHASNGRTLFLRIARDQRAAKSSDGLSLQIRSTHALTASAYTFKFRRLI
ncbi:hypothetical protein [Photobacterium ganghwense]|uniref:hypothetical protein n=1 Tax=Photobacterium ganghwense TaxID=320778 RepID=UPI0039F0F99E